MSTESTTCPMTTTEARRIIRLLKETAREERTREEITQTFIEAGIITAKGNLREPYKELFVPQEK